MATVEAVTPWAAVYGTARSGRAKVGRLVEAVNRVIDRRDIRTVFRAPRGPGNGGRGGLRSVHARPARECTRARSASNCDRPRSCISTGCWLATAPLKP